MRVLIRNMNSLNVEEWTDQEFLEMVEAREKTKLTIKEAVDIYTDHYMPGNMMFSIDGMSAHEFVNGR